MENLEIYNKVQSVPKEAQKEIGAGRLRGMTDINPMWRIQTLTETFGPCGIGWYYEITKQWLEPGSDGNVVAFVNINLYIKLNNEWSKPIIGTGGSSFIAKESKGLYTSDECYKMALTDAISVACKALGFGADIYWKDGKSKYDKPKEDKPPKNNETPKQGNLSDKQIQRLYVLASKANYKEADVKKHIKSMYGLESTKDLTKEQYDYMCNGYQEKAGDK